MADAEVDIPMDDAADDAGDDDAAAASEVGLGYGCLGSIGSMSVCIVCAPCWWCFCCGCICHCNRFCWCSRVGSCQFDSAKHGEEGIQIRFSNRGKSNLPPTKTIAGPVKVQVHHMASLHQPVAFDVQQRCGYQLAGVFLSLFEVEAPVVLFHWLSPALPGLP